MKRDNERIRYYCDELNDDFADIHIEKNSIKSDYKYLSKNPFFKAFAVCFRYLVAIPLLFLINKICYGVKVKNRNVLKAVKKRGYYLYSNHVVDFDPIMQPVMYNPGKYCLIVAGKETFSINPFVSFLVKALGAVPVPNTNDIKMYKNYCDCLHYHINKKHRVLIYPEAHIWPYYTGIRRFSNASFHFPVNDNCPIMISTTVFKKRKYRKKPKVIIYLDGPFFPNLELSKNARVSELANIAYETMVKRSNVDWNYSYIKYIKKDNKESK